MAKNAVLQFMKERQRQVDFEGHSPAYGYWTSIEPGLEDVMRLIGSPEVEVFCDANIFAREGLPIVEAVARRPTIVLTQEVHAEVAEYLSIEPRIPENKAVHQLLQTVLRFKLPEDRPYATAYGALNYYVTLLMMRRTLLQSLIEAAEKGVGRALAVKERGDIGSLYAKVMLGTGSIGTKNVEQSKTRTVDRATDEWLVVRALFEAIWNRKSVVLLSFDDDVFSQFFKAISLMADDYLSHLVATDIAAHSDRYTRRYEMRDYVDMDRLVADKTRSYALGRSGEVAKLFPPSDAEPFVILVKPRPEPQIIATQCLAGIRPFLQLKSRTLGRNIDTDDGLNCYVQLVAPTERPQLPSSGGPFVFFLDDKMVVNCPEMRISEADRLRSIVPIERPIKGFVPMIVGE